jgi:hypothetical protein
MLKRKRNHSYRPLRVCQCVKCFKESVFEPQPYTTVWRHEQKYGIHVRLTEVDVVFEDVEDGHQEDHQEDGHQEDEIQVEEELRELMDALAAEEHQKMSPMNPLNALMMKKVTKKWRKH